ncbi:unnamed protein product, partial [Trichogramma brassicae]
RGALVNISQREPRAQLEHTCAIATTAAAVAALRSSAMRDRTRACPFIAIPYTQYGYRCAQQCFITSCRTRRWLCIFSKQRISFCSYTDACIFFIDPHTSLQTAERRSESEKKQQQQQQRQRRVNISRAAASFAHQSRAYPKQRRCAARLYFNVKRATVNYIQARLRTTYISSAKKKTRAAEYVICTGGRYIAACSRVCAPACMYAEREKKERSLRNNAKLPDTSHPQSLSRGRGERCGGKFTLHTQKKIRLIRTNFYIYILCAYTERESSAVDGSTGYKRVSRAELVKSNRHILTRAYVVQCSEKWPNEREKKKEKKKRKERAEEGEEESCAEQSSRVSQSPGEHEDDRRKRENNSGNDSERSRVRHYSNVNTSFAYFPSHRKWTINFFIFINYFLKVVFEDIFSKLQTDLPGSRLARERNEHARNDLRFIVGIYIRAYMYRLAGGARVELRAYISLKRQRRGRASACTSSKLLCHSKRSSDPKEKSANVLYTLPAEPPEIPSTYYIGLKDQKKKKKKIEE